FGLERAVVARVGDAVLVVVRIGHAVLVLEAVLVFGVERGAVAEVEHAILVVVRIRAAVFILEAVLIFRLLGAGVLVVADAVLVRVARFGRRFLRLFLALREPNLGHGAEVGRAVAAEQAGAAGEAEHEALRAVVLQTA